MCEKTKSKQSKLCKMKALRAERARDAALKKYVHEKWIEYLKAKEKGGDLSAYKFDDSQST